MACVESSLEPVLAGGGDVDWDGNEDREAAFCSARRVW